MRAHWIAVLVVTCLAYSAFGEDLKKTDQEALQKTQDLLKDKSQRDAAIKGDPGALKADDFISQLTGGDAAVTEEIYALAADVFSNVVKNSGGDVEKMTTDLEKFMKDPAAFAATWTPEQKAKLKSLSEKLKKPSLAPK